MLRVMAMRGDARMAEMARLLLRHDQKFRDDRLDLGSAEMEFDPAAANCAFLAPAFAQTEARVLDRAVYDGGGRAALPGTLLRREGDPPSGNASADEAFDGAGAVHDLYFTEYGRNSLDGKGMKLTATVNHRRGYNNAFWNGAQMVYGAGDGRIFRTFTELSIISHEMSHGVVQFSGGLTYQGQSGALNESFADVFGALSVQRAAGESANAAHWLIGKGIFGPEIRGAALRSMKMPGTAYADAVLGQDPQPYHMDHYVDTTDDNGGVHINSGIPNHAFYLYCMYLGGNAWGAPGKIWYHALQRLNNPMASFHDWAVQTLESAIELHRIGASEVNALRRAWKLVGIAV